MIAAEIILAILNTLINSDFRFLTECRETYGYNRTSRHTIYGTGNGISGPPDFIHDLSSIETAYGCRHQLFIVRIQ